MSKGRPHPSKILGNLVAQALAAGSNELETEYENGYEIVYAVKGGTGIGIADLKSDSKEAEALRSRLQHFAGKGGTVSVGGVHYRLKVTTYESFGELNYKVAISEA